jgi:hypothetical protein
VDHGVTTLDELRGKLGVPRRSAWVRALVGPAGDERTALLYLQAVVGPRPPGWRKQSWMYPQCTFTSAQMTAGRLARILDPGKPHHLVVGGVRGTVEVHPGQLSFVHAPSLAQQEEIRLPWPSFVYNPATTLSSANAPQGYLVGAGDVPSFPVFSGAFNAFFNDKFAVTGTGNPQLGKISIHCVDTGARIRRVRVRPASLEVRLGGSSLANTFLELNGAESRAVVAIQKPRVVFELPGGLPSDAWLWLKRDSDWLDFRSLSGWGGYQGSDVEIELPEDPLAEVSRLAAQGEGAKLEYKEKLPDTQSEKRTVFKTVVAFANGDGGTILFGVSDDGDIKGLEGNLAEERRRLVDLIRSLVTPPPEVQVRQQELDGRSVLMAEVSPGHGTLYALVVDSNKPEYYVRRDGTTYYARPEELATTIARANVEAGSRFGLTYL